MTALFDALTDRTDPDRTFLDVGGGRTWSYGEVYDLAARMATVLRRQGAVEGAGLMVQVGKSPEAVALYLAALRVGATYIPLNPSYTAAEVGFFVGDAEPALLVLSPPQVGEVTTRELSIAATPVLTLAADGSGTFIDQAGGVAAEVSPSPRGGRETVAMLYTSGTTGRPKGAMLSSDNLLTNAETLSAAWGWRSDDVLLHVLPIFHTHGLFVALHLAMMSGSRVLFHDRFTVDSALDAVPRATVMMGVPTYYRRLLASPSLDDIDLAGVRLFTSGSAPLLALTHEEFERRTGHRILERYGMTETGMLTSNPLDGERVAGTVGLALPGVEVRVVDDADARCPPEQVGNVQARGPNVFTGYWRLPDKTAAGFTEDAFFRTGDLGRLDAGGRLTLVGRTSDLIISGGLNVYPKEVELVLDAHPQVEESAVIGVPHPDFGEAVVAAVVPAGTLDIADLRAEAAVALAGFKQPKHYEFVDALPRNSMGKVAKTELRRRLAHLYEQADRSS